jgi:parallel beta-helix repeat protein
VGLFSQETFTKTLLSPNIFKLSRDFPVEKKTLLKTAFITVLLLSTVAETQLVNLACANMFPAPVPEHNIEIREDGSVVGTNEIQRNGTVYTFTGDVFGTIVVSCDGIVINGAGHALRGNGTSTGFFLQGRKHVTIRNVRISNFRIGIASTWWWPLGRKDNPNNVFQGNIITNTTYGITASLVGGVTILENIISNNEVGIAVFCLHYLLVSGNHISNNGEGIKIIDGEGSVYNNSFTNNTLQVNCDPDSAGYGKISVILWDSNYWSDYNDIDSIGDVPYIIDAYNQDNSPLMAPVEISNFVPSIAVLSPENKTYDTSSIPLNFTVNAAVSQITYSLDEEENITFSGNTTLAGLANGDHNITVYFRDGAGDAGSETIYFSVNVPFPTTMVIAPIASVVVAGAGLLVYFVKSKKRSQKP